MVHKENMKVVFVDEALETISLLISFKNPEEAKKRKFENPVFFEWEYGKAGDALDMGYWTSDNMNDLMCEYIELFEFLFPGQVVLLIVDWGSNHLAMATDARTISNMRILAGGERRRKIKGVMESCNCSSRMCSPRIKLAHQCHQDGRITSRLLKDWVPLQRVQNLLWATSRTAKEWCEKSCH